MRIIKKTRSKTVKRHAIGAATMTIGSFAVFFLVFMMNAQKHPVKNQNESQAVAFEIEKPKPPKPERKRERQKPPRPKRSNAVAPKTPNLASAISEAALDLPGFDAASLGNVASHLIGDFSKKSPMTEGAMDDPPKVRGRGGQLQYPSDARKRGVEGHVLMNIFIREDGSVGTIKVLDANPKGVFEESAKSHVADWIFDPGTYENEPVSGWVKQRVVFKLQRG